MVVEHFKVTLDFEVTVDETSGEIVTKCVKKSIDKTGFVAKEPKATKPKKEESSEPILTLESNKYCLNAAAVELMGVSPGDKLLIKEGKVDNKIVPMIGTEENLCVKGGNKLTQSFTVSYRGVKNQELAKYGTEFTLVPNESKQGVFILYSKDQELADSEDVESMIDLDLQSIIDEGDANITEIDESLFNLNV